MGIETGANDSGFGTSLGDKLLEAPKLAAVFRLDVPEKADAGGGAADEYAAVAGVFCVVMTGPAAASLRTE